ncbi:complex I intermediate-associated protein CIA30 [Epithele typhae]|uniref:complex I intermediate-associated protein CIA30 n=1 Tax=Epithele typhae TaxID=378194 RepID=UPI0020072AE3|nr:complex I intermediate-associated protein CIA30 [Epithele typhae]KAH9945460.1 complex I intermediate-associated protein CIA30 [Epithele typhae]
MSRLSAYMNRSAKVFTDTARRMILMEGADMPSRLPISLYTFNSHEDISQYAKGCDADVGGTSTVNFALDESTATPSTSEKPHSPHEVIVNRPTGKFWGEMKLGVRTGLEQRIRGGYAGFRNKPRPTLFGEMSDDVSHHGFLALRVSARGHPRTRNSYFVNLQTDGPITTDLWQHRLFFRKDDGSWEDVFIPFKDFVLTNAGELVPEQIRMYRERVRSIGISILGGNSGVEGPYELGIDSIRAVNIEDVTDAAALEKAPTEGTQWQRPPVL